jgi:predicted methyltransferase
MVLAGGAALALGGCEMLGPAKEPITPMSPYIASAVRDSARPEEDVARDGARKPAHMLAFAEVEPGMRIAEFIPGSGYFTRVFAPAVGPAGRVYAVISPQQAANTENPPAVNAIAADPHYANVRVLVSGFQDFAAPEPLDMVFTAQNYHDLHLTRFNLDVGAVNVAVFNALKPGGRYIIIDHSAQPGADVSVANTLHRIDPAIVRREVESAGFVFERESDALANPADPRTMSVFADEIRGQTDQFVMAFRKPR